MGSSVRPERPNPFADLAAQERGNQAKPAPANPFSDLADEEHHTSVPIGATLDSTPRLTPVGADGRPAVVMAEPPSALSRTRAAIGQQVDAFKAHPLDTALGLGKTIVTAPVKSFLETFDTPVVGEEVSAARANRGKGGPMPGDLRAGQVITTQNTPGAITERQMNEAGLQTVANVAAGGIGRGASAVAGKVFPKALAGLMGAGTAGATIGAAYDPQDPLVGAGVGATVGGALHVAAPVVAGAAALPMRALDRATDVSGGMMEAGAAGAARQVDARQRLRFSRSVPAPEPTPAPAEPPLANLKGIGRRPKAEVERLAAEQAAREAAATPTPAPTTPAASPESAGFDPDKTAPVSYGGTDPNARILPNGSRVPRLTKAMAARAKGTAPVDAAPASATPDVATETTAAPDLPIEHAPLKAKVLELTKQLGRVAQERDEARRTAETDALTGLANRGAYDHALPSAEQDPATSVVRFDLNGFKAVNDRVSHQAGDEVLRSMRGVMEQAAKDTGIPARAFRVGGDEFAALVPKEQADAFRARVEELYGVQEHAPGVKSSVSGGIGETDAAADAEAITRKQAHKAAQGIAGRGETPATPAPPTDEAILAKPTGITAEEGIAALARQKEDILAGRRPKPVYDYVAEARNAATTPEAVAEPPAAKPSLGDRLRATEAKAPEPAAPAAHEPPVEEIDVDAREAERVKAEKKAARDAAKAKREESDAPQSKKPSDYRVMTPEQLLDEMHSEYSRIEAEGNKMRGPWSRFDDDISAQVTGGRFSDARAVQQAAFAKRRLTAIEGELAKRGVTPDEIAEGMQARRERDLMQTGDAEGGDTSFDFGEPEAKAIEAAPASPAAKEAAATRPREYINYFRKNLDQTTEARVRALVDEGRATGAIDKGTKTFAEQQAEADAFAKKLVSDPLLLDRQKLGKLSGAEVQGVWQVVQQNGRLMEAASRVLNDPAATPDAIAEAQHVYDAATSSTNEALATVVRESARTARDLGFYRQFARQTLDPEVWLVQAKKLLGDRPLTEEMMMEVRRLANAAKQTCGGG